MKYKNIIFIMASSFIAPNAWAQAGGSGGSDISVLPVPGPNMSDVVIDSNLSINGTNKTILDIYPGCYGTNLRSVSNPVSPVSTITAHIQYTASDNSLKTLRISFPAEAALKTKSLDMDLSPNAEVYNVAGVKTTETISARLKDSLIRVTFSNTKTIGLDVLASGTDYGALLDSSAKTDFIRSVGFVQTMPAGSSHQQYMGWNGPLSASTRWYTSENAKHITIYASFPGQNKFCGGYYSPLVLKFNDLETLPQVTASSFFPLFGKEKKGEKVPKISWPNFLKKEDMYFLGLDKDGNGTIDYGGELFGDINGYKNGFENLKIHDDNKDGVIDEKDAVFKKLVLWKDNNGDGICQKKEVIPLSARGVTSISLDYVNDLTGVGPAAKILGPGSFTYKNKKGETVRGVVWDIFLQVVN